MRGITLFADSFLLIFTLAIIVIVSLFIWYLVLANEAMDILMPGGSPTTRTVEMTLLYRPVEYDNMLTTFLESEYQGVRVKRIMNAVAIQGSTSVWLDGSTIDASEAASDFFNSRIGRPYILKIDDIIIVQSGSFSNVAAAFQKVTAVLFLLNGKEAYLQLLVVN